MSREKNPGSGRCYGDIIQSVLDDMFFLKHRYYQEYLPVIFFNNFDVKGCY